MVVSSTLKKSPCLPSFIFFTFQVKIIIKEVLFQWYGAREEQGKAAPYSCPLRAEEAGAVSMLRRVHSHSTRSSRAQTAQESPGRSAVKSRGQVQISQYTARHMHSFIIVDTRIRIQVSSWAKAESLCLPQPFLTRVWCKIIKLHNLFICGFLVPSSPFSKSPHSVKVLNSMYIENFQYHKSSHVHLFSPQLSLNIFVLGETELTLEQCASLSSVWHWKNC